MTRHVLLNNIAHKDLRVITRLSAELGDNVGTVMVVPTEYSDLMREYPIFFRKDPASGEYTSIVLLGFSREENLFLDENGWNADYVPGIVARGPFLIGVQDQQGNGQRTAVIHVDMDHPRLSETEGEPVFLPQGGNSRYIENIANILNGISEGLAVSKAMFAAFTEADLIEPVKVEIKISETERYDLLGLHTISIEKLRKLDGVALEKLNRPGFLQGAYLVASSLSNVRRLIDMKRRGQQRQTLKAS
jgi:hypothetical protein